MRKTWRTLLAVLLTFLLAAVPALAYDGTMPLTEEKVTLTVLTTSGVNASYPPSSNDLPFWQWVEEQTNVHIEWEIIPTESYNEVISTRLASGEALPDIVNCGSMANAMMAGQAGLVIDMAPYFEENAPYTWAKMQEDPFIKASYLNSDGTIYGFGDYVTPVRNQIVLMYNRQWLEQVGEEIPTTTEEFVEVCKKMVGVDFNGNGKADEIILTCPDVVVMDSLSQPFGLELFEGWDAFSANEEGVVRADYIADEMKTYWEFMKRLYDEGILDPEFFNTNWNSFYEKVAADRVGVFMCYSSFATSCGNMTTWGSEHVNEELYTIGLPLEGPTGERWLMARERAFGGNTCVSSACKHPEIAIRWLDALFLNPDFIETRYWGFEGETYSVNADGTREMIKPADGTSWEVSRDNLGCGQIALPHWQDEELMFLHYANDPGMAWWNDQDLALLPYFRSPTVPHIPLSVEERETYDLYASDVGTYFREMMAKYVTGLESFDNWENYVATMKALGVDELTRVFQSVYDRTR